MSSKLRLACEPFAAVWAGNRPVTGVKPLVQSQLFAARKTFSAVGAGKRLVAGVDSEMFDEPRLKRVSFPAHGTRKCALLCVNNPLMSAQSELPYKAFPALLTRKRLFPRVDFLVPEELRLLFVLLPALWTHEGGLAAVGQVVSTKRRVCGEAFPTLGTFIQGLLIVVHFLVSGEAPLRFEGLPTVGASERPFAGVSLLVPVSVGLPLETSPAH